MTALPSGTVTFLFTDIAGSTRLWEQHPQAMPQALARHDTLLRQTIERYEGSVFKLIGDAFCAAFHTAPQALAAALDAQRALAAEPWGATGPITVRMALHTGVTEQRDGDYVGPALNRISRLLAAGHGGQVLFSAATQELVHDDLPEGVSLRDLGQRRLRDLTRPEHIYQLVAPGLPADFAPLKTLEQRRTNLPVQPTSLIGREREIAQLVSLLHQEHARLVTLTGPGGTGKTRLALQLAAELLDDYPDGVCFVDLAPLRDPELVLPTLAQTLGLTEDGQTPLLQRLQDKLTEQRLLLLLDNFEQVVAAAPLLGQLLQAAPHVTLLVTSRVVLHLRGEKEYPVPPLGLPDMRRLPPLEQLTQYEAVRLFITRAQDVRPDFEITTATAPAIAEICHRLDGLPLAIELAAARIRLLPPEQLLQRLNQRLRLLTGGPRDLPQRQQTLRSTIDWSYQLLDEPQQRLLRWLGVFVGSFDLEAAEAVCRLEGDHQLDILEGLARLQEQSLLRQAEVAGEPRFWMLETLREYALEQLVASGELERLQRQHAEHYLALAEEFGVHKPDALKRLVREQANLRAVLSRAMLRDELAPAARLGAALGPFWATSGYLREGVLWKEYVLARRSKLDAHLRARVLLESSRWTELQGDYASARAMCEESLQLYRQLEDAQGVARALLRLGIVVRAVGDYALARSCFEEGLAMQRRLGDQHYIIGALVSLGDLAAIQDEYEQARPYYEDGLAINRELACLACRNEVLRKLGSIACKQGQYARARALLGESLALVQELGAGPGRELQAIATFAARTGAAHDAVRLLAASKAWRDAIGIRPSPSFERDYEQSAMLARAAIDEPTFAGLWAEGQAMSPEQALACAWEVLKERS